jgi:hypothetical protein
VHAETHRSGLPSSLIESLQWHWRWQSTRFNKPASPPFSNCLALRGSLALLRTLPLQSVMDTTCANRAHQMACFVKYFGNFSFSWWWFRCWCFDSWNGTTRFTNENSLELRIGFQSLQSGVRTKSYFLWSEGQHSVQNNFLYVWRESKRERSRPNLKYCYRWLPEGTENNHKILNQENQYPIMEGLRKTKKHIGAGDGMEI